MQLLEDIKISILAIFIVLPRKVMKIKSSKYNHNFEFFLLNSINIITDFITKKILNEI